MKTLDEDQQRRLADATPMYRGVIRMAYTLQPANKASPRMAIRAFCLQCVGYVRNDITNCTATACPLWHYRPYQPGDPDEPEEGASPALGTPETAQNAPGGTGGGV